MEKTAAIGAGAKPTEPDAEAPNVHRSPKLLRSYRTNLGLTARRVRRIRTLYQEGKEVESLAKKYGVSQSSIYAALSGKTWKDAGGPIQTKDSRRRRIRRSSRMNEERVREARRLFEKGQSLTELARRFGASTGTMSDLVRGKTWSHVPGATQVRKGRRGENSASAKLTVEAVYEIRREMSRGAFRSDLARKYGVSTSAIRSVELGLSWKHLP